MATAEEELFQELMNLQRRMSNQSPDSTDSGTEDDANKGLAMAIGQLLANTVSVYHEAHGLHWNVKGEDFSQYHALFGEIYDDVQGSIDGTAELILKLGYDAPFHMSKFVEIRSITETDADDEPMSMANELLRSLEALVAQLKNVFKMADEADEQGIANFIADRIDSTQKWVWQLRASTGKQKSIEF
jgi:starvation-inducible DNA-binding protein